MLGRHSNETVKQRVLFGLKGVKTVTSWQLKRELHMEIPWRSTG